MNFKEELDKVLKQYRERVGSGPFTHVIFFKEDEDDDMDHLLCYEGQIQAVVDYTEWYKPRFLLVRAMAETEYIFREEVNATKR